MAAYMSAHLGHPRAENLMGKDLLVEFAWCAQYATALSIFAYRLRLAISSPKGYEWPEQRPDIPKREGFSGESRRRS